MDDHKISDNFQRTEGCKMISPHHSHPTNGVRPSDSSYIYLYAFMCALFFVFGGCCTQRMADEIISETPRLVDYVARSDSGATLCCEASKVACDNVVTNGVIHSRWIVESSLNNTIIDNLPTERALIFDVCDAGKRVELNNAEKIQLRWCLADARIVDYIPIKLGVCDLKNFDYVLGIGELCKCKRCQEERSDFCTLVGADYAFVQSVVFVYLSKDGDSDIKFADDKRQQKFLELVVPKIQLLSIAK